MEILPHLIPAMAACLFLLGAAFTNRRSCWGPLCLLIVTAAAVCLWFSGELQSQKVQTAAGDSIVRDGVVSKLEADRAIPTESGWAGRSLRQDALAVGIQWLALLIAALFALMAFAEQRESPTAAEHFALLLFILSGMMIVAAANDLILLFLSVELIGIAASLLVVISEPLCNDSLKLDREALHPTATNFLLINMFASGILLFGFCMLYGVSGSIVLDPPLDVSPTGIRQIQTVGSGSSPHSQVALVFIFAAIGVKCGVVGFHFGLTEIADSTPWTMGFITVVLQTSGLVVLIRILPHLAVGWEDGAQVLLLVFAVGSMMYGNVMAIRAPRIGPILSYLAVSQTGLLLTALCVGVGASGRLKVDSGLPDGVQSALFYLVAYSICITGLFAVLIYLCRADRRMDFIDDLAGLIDAQPLPAVIAILLLFSLAGLPPLPGFWGRLLIMTAALNVPAQQSSAGIVLPDMRFVFLVTVVILNVVLTGVVALRLIVIVAIGSPRSRPQPAGGQSALVAAMIASIVALLLGLSPGPLLGFLDGVESPGQTLRQAQDK